MTARDRHDTENIAKLRARLETESSDSIRLLKNINDNPICSVTFDESISAIVVIWRQHATSTQLRFVHENILHLVEKHRVSKVLGDDSDLPTIHAEDRAWIVEDWMPRAIAAGLKFAVSKNPVFYFGKISVSSVQAIAPAGLVTRSFDKIDDAKRWLQNVAAS
jgi:hypothetical protein